MGFLLNNIKTYKVKYIVSLLLGLVIVSIYIGTRGYDKLIYYMDAFSIAGVALILVAALSCCTNFGAFDIFSYNFKKIFTRMDAKNFADYVENNRIICKKNRFIFLPYLAVGLLLLLTGLIILAFI